MDQQDQKRLMGVKRGGALFLLVLFIVSTALAVFAPFGAREARADEPMWEAAAVPVEPPVCGNWLVAGPGLGLCTDVGVAQRTTDKVKNNVLFQLLSAAFYGFLDAGTYLAQTVAYDTATWIADGGPASGPLFYGKDFGTYLGDVAKDSVGEFVATMSEDFTNKFGLNLCKPPTWQAISLDLALSIPDIVLPMKGRPTPKCPWMQLTQNWEAAKDSLTNAEALANIGATFQTGGNDLSFAINAHAPLLNAVMGAREAAVLNRLEGAGFKPVKDIVTGNIKTPSQTVREAFHQKLITEPFAVEQGKNQTIASQAFQLGFIELGKATISTFVNTLASKLLSKLMKGLFQPAAEGGSSYPDLANPFAAPPAVTKPQAIFSEQFKDILTPKLSSSEEENLLVELQASCTGAARTKWACAIDANLALALTQGGITVRQAIDRGFLNPNARLIPSSRLQDNQDPTCASSGDRLCVGNLRKLRLARIIPIGWELAAESPTNHARCASGQGCVTLSEVIAAFDNCNYNASAGGSSIGALDASHPWCHLIDPNWILASFPSKCMVKGYGGALAQGSSERLSECADTVSCLRRDADGKCVGGYGYCLAEQPFWQFDAQSCKEQYVSCRIFTPRGKGAKPIGYLRSTLDYGSCNASNVGCMWYATTRNPAAGENAWTATYGGTLGKIYFDSAVASCNSKDDGCTDLRKVVPGQIGVNLLQNSSFEEVDPNAPGELLGWRYLQNDQGTTAPFNYAPPATTAFDGQQAVDPPDAYSLSQFVRVEPNRQYTLSFYARQGTGGLPSVYMRLFPAGANPDVLSFPLAPINFTSLRMFGTGCTISGTGISVNANAVGADWSRYQCSFTTPPGTTWGQVALTGGSYIDAVQLEESEAATAYFDGLNPNLASVDMRVPPPELGCTGSKSDNPLCASYARVCRQNEAGCTAYRLKRQPDSPEVPAILTPGDTCPAECVGYAEFHKQASTFDYVRNPSNPLLNDPNDNTVAYFIPNTARMCDAQSVGCELFTNLGAAEQGGDASQAYSYLRTCQKPDDTSQTYYTWEGSDESGYQLRTWSLARDASAAAPQGPRVLQKPGPDGALKNPTDCNSTTYIQGFDPDCRQFYDPQGNVFYRYESQTILSDEKCQQFRLDRSGQADCELTGGVFNNATNSCTYSALGSKSRTCSAAAAGCRGYMGTAGKAQTVVFSEDFSNTTYGVYGVDFGGVERSEESVLVGDHSLRVYGNESFAFDVPTEPGVMYEITLWAKRADTPRNLDMYATIGGNFVRIGSMPLTSDWRVYRVGPFQAADTVTNVISDTTGGMDTFIDKIRVERVSDITYAVKDSWVTPPVCDETLEGIPEPRAMLGCEAYTDRTGATSNVRQFSRLCSESVIGCTAFVNTANSESPYGKQWTRTSPNGTEITVNRGDFYQYYVPEKTKLCKASAVGCRAYGLPKFSQDRLSLQSFSTVYLKNDPSRYDDALCSEGELFCESYTYSADGQSGTAYFRAPADHVCEYREAVTVGSACGIANPSLFAGRTYDGWFKTGTDCPCYADRVMNGSIFGLRYTGDPGYNAWRGENQTLYGTNATYQGWSAVCPEAQSECTELRDPSDRSDPLHPLGRAYYVIKDSRLDRESCNGQIDSGNGCVLFRDLSDAQLTYSSAATQDAYRERGYRPVAPVDCVGNPTHPSCARMPNGPYGSFCHADGTQACTRAQLGATNAGDTLTAYASCIANSADTLHPCNDANLIVKVKPDRACSQWLACKTGETVYDESAGTFKGVCSELALCNAASTEGAEGVPFCTSYVNRSWTYGTIPSYVSRTPITILNTDIVTDARTYSVRPTGFGAVDYSGMTIPDHFQVMDAKLVPVGSLLSPDPKVAGKFKKDYRLAVPVTYSGTGALAADMDDNDAQLRALVSDQGMRARVCRLGQNGSYGMMSGNYCWFSVDQERPPVLAGVADTIISDNLIVPALMTRFAQDKYPKLDQMLSRAFPDAQCKSSPEPQSPFGNEYVLEWDDSVNPPQVKRVADGYENANFCEYGESCECVYKRVTYKGPTKYYEPFSTDVVNAICLGGPRDGLPCVADVGVQGSQDLAAASGSTTNTVNFVSYKPSADQQCGSGTCTPISGTTLVRGMTGQCLEYDISRPRAGSSESECLLWNPNPILTGSGDQYHWQPTAGFQPPQSSGRYYCTSPVRKPRVQPFRPFAAWPRDLPQEGVDWGKFVLDFFVPYAALINAGFDLYNELMRTAMIGAVDSCPDKMNCQGNIGPMANSEGMYAGKIRALAYADWFTSDGSCVNFLFLGGCTGNEDGASLDGHRAEGTQEGLRCEQIDDEGQAFIHDPTAMRLVTTGQGEDHSYAEYAILFNPIHTAYGALGYKPVDMETVLNYSTEDAISNFSFSVPKEKIGCAYSEVWTDAHVDDYDGGRDKWLEGDNKWHASFQKFLQESGGNVLDRKNAKIVTEDGTPTGIPVKVNCAIPNDPDRSGDDGRCYIKTWEMDYRAEGMDRFRAFTPDIGRESLDHLSRRPLYGRCESSHPWFAIRAVFEDVNSAENDLDPVAVNADQLTGPFQFVGLWVTACAPGDQTRYIYMRMNLNTADVCRELAETISKDSHDSVAFTDRNSARSGFTMSNGFSWNTTNLPFGASLATGDAGKQPLYMTGVRQSEVNPMNPPTFTYPGQTYFQSRKYPINNWGLLSNVFAKIYRIYGYFPRGVSRRDWACTNKASPEFGQWCPNLSRIDSSRRAAVSQEYCGFGGKCMLGGMDAENLFATKACNVFSGVNRGLDCSSDPDICHRAPMEEIDGVPTPVYGGCHLFAGYYPPAGSVGTSSATRQTVDARWSSIGSTYFRCTGTNCPSNCTAEGGCTRTAAVQGGAFRCDTGTARGPDQVLQTVGSPAAETYASYCTKPSDHSSECPAMVIPKTTGSCISGTCSGEGAPWAACAKDSDCSFYARNWWPSGESNNRFMVSSYTDMTNLGYYDKAFPTAHAKYPFTGSSEFFYAASNYDNGIGVGLENLENSAAAMTAFYPAVPYDAQITRTETTRSNDSYSRLFQTAISPGLLPRSMDNVLTYDTWDDSSLMALQPGFNPLIFMYGNGYGSPNFKDPSPGSAGSNALLLHTSSVPPFVFYEKNTSWATAYAVMSAHYGACESVALMFQNTTTVNRVAAGGICHGGSRSGASCSTDTDCQNGAAAAGTTASNWCNPVTSGLNTNPTLSYGILTTTNNADGYDNSQCWRDAYSYDPSNPLHPKNEEDPAKDSNICTHPAGYWPRPNYCPDPDDEYCGLFGYVETNVTGSVVDTRPIPTDVTEGFFTPSYLNPTGYAGVNKNSFSYINYYNPVPPQIAAPDVRTCQGEQCRIAGTGTFAVDGLVGGIANGGVGTHIADVRFYAWASDDQMPLRRIVIDWGDNTVTEIPDAYMKNRKPYCDTSKECSAIPGLTCNTDADCPAGGGACIALGNCTNNPDIRCSSDKQCMIGGEGGICEPRVAFGSDGDGCEERYLEFRHSYSCMPDNLPTNCAYEGGQLSPRCSRNNATVCSATACGVQDTCIDQMAPPAGCYDATNNRCLFTPRIKVVDNWGWCAGECRNHVNSSGKLDDSGNSYIHPSGGCYNGSGVKSNIDFSTPIGPNECDPSSQAGANDRPWIVFPGSVQLLPGESI